MNEQAVALADIEFYENHPERNFKPITPEEARSNPELVDEWNSLYRKHLIDPQYAADDAAPGTCQQKYSSQPSLDCDDGVMVCDSKPTSVTPIQEDQPCDFDLVEVSCKHCGKKGHRKTLSNITFWVEGSDRKLMSNPTDCYTLELVAGSREQAKDKLSVHVTNGPGPCGDHDHPEISVRGNGVNEVTANKLEVKLGPRLRGQLPKLDSFTAFVGQHYFPQEEVAEYDLRVQSCAFRSDATPNFGYFHLPVKVYPSSQYKLSIKLPSVFKKSWKHERDKAFDPAKQSNSKTTTKAYQKTSEKESSYSESKDGVEVKYKEVYSYADKSGTVSESTEIKETEGESQKVGMDYALGEEKKPDGSAKLYMPIGWQVARTLTFTRTEEGDRWDLSNEVPFGKVLETIADFKNRFLEVLNSVKKFQPRIGWMVDVDLEFIHGNIDLSWGYKEWEDHRVYRGWKVETSLTLVSGKVTLSFGIDKKIWGNVVTAKASGSLSGDVQVKVEYERTPLSDNGGVFSPKIPAKFAADIGLTLSGKVLGYTLLDTKGNVGSGFNGEATPTMTDDEPFYLGVSIDWSGVEISAVIDTPLGKWSGEWEVMEKRNIWEGEFFRQ